MKINKITLTSAALITLISAPIISTAITAAPLTAQAKTVPGVTKTISPDHSDLDKLIEQTKKDGFDVTQLETIVQQTSSNTVDADSEDITNIDYAQQIADLQAQIDKYNQELKAYNDAMTEAENSGTIIAQENGITVYGTYNEAGCGSADYYSNIKILVDPQVAGEDAALEQAIGWQSNTEIVNISMDESESNNSGSETWGKVQAGQQFMLTNVGSTRSGKNLNIRFTVIETPTELKTQADTHGISVKGGVDGELYFNGIGYDKYPLTYEFLDDAGNPVKIATGFPIGDIDGSQKLTTDFDNIALLNPSDSLLTEDGDFISSDNDAIKNFESENEINGFSQTPVGTIAVVGLGDTFNYTHYNRNYAAEGRPTANHSRIFWGMFSSNLALDTIVKPMPLELEYQLTDLEYQTESIEVQPSKDIELTIGNGSIDGQDIGTGQIFYYRLISSYYPANRDEFTSWKMVDDFDQKHDQYNSKFEIHAINKNGVIQSDSDFEKYLTENKNKLIKTDIKGGVLTYTATKEFIDYLNNEMKNSDVQFAIYPEFVRIASGDVENNVTENWNGNNELSNTVVTHTPDKAPNIEIEQKETIKKTVEVEQQINDAVRNDQSLDYILDQIPNITISNAAAVNNGDLANTGTYNPIVWVFATTGLLGLLGLSGWYIENRKNNKAK